MRSGGRTTYRVLSHTFNRKTPAGTIVNDPVNVQYNLKLPIQFSDGAPVIETLELLQLKIADVLNAFQPFFDE
jgi:hypothetical protein